jgi:EmrB/QacA subfamily drug resistance transporter
MLVLSGLMVGTLMASLDQTIVATALPTVVGDLGGIRYLSWVVTAYLLASTASTALYGKLSDIYGRKPLYQIAITLFLVGSILCGAAQNMEMLIGARAIQGLGGGGLLVVAFAIIGDVIPPRERGKYQGYFGAVFGVSSIAGPLLGGFFVDGPGWRWIFYINVPIGLAALYVTSRHLTNTAKRQQHKIDWLGAALLVGGVSALLLSLEQGRDRGWGSTPILGLEVLALVLLGLFLWVESRVDEPILPLPIFKIRTFAVTSGLAFLTGMGLFGVIVFLPVYLQIVKGLSPTASGLATLPLMLGLLFASIGSGRIISARGKYKIFPIIGLGITFVALILLATLETDTPRWQYSGYMLLLGLGFGCTTQILVLAAQNSVERKDLGVATSTATFVRQMGGTFGTAIFGTVLVNRLVAGINERLPNGVGDGCDPRAIAGAPSAILRCPAEVRGPIQEAFVSALNVTFFVAVPLIGIAFVLAFFLKEIPLEKRAKAKQPTEPTEPAPIDA